MLSWIWGGMMALGIGYGFFTGRGGVSAQSVQEAVLLVFKMAGGFMLWNGLFEIVAQSGAARGIARGMKPVLKKLFKGVEKEESLTAITMNLTMNMLGLGNAATPMGLKAMESLREESACGDVASPAMCMFLVINASSLQLLPTTVISLRQAAGSAAPESIVLPTLCATAASTLVGILACKAFEKAEKHPWK